MLVKNKQQIILGSHRTRALVLTACSACSTLLGIFHKSEMFPNTGSGLSEVGRAAGAQSPKTGDPSGKSWLSADGWHLQDMSVVSPFAVIAHHPHIAGVVGHLAGSRWRDVPARCQGKRCEIKLQKSREMPNVCANWGAIKMRKRN